MKIKFLQAYQAVRFGTGLHSYFVDDRYRTESHGTKVARVRMEAREFGVLVYDEKCAVLVGWANVGSLEYDRDSLNIKEESETKSAPKSKTDSKPAQK